MFRLLAQAGQPALVAGCAVLAGCAGGAPPSTGTSGPMPAAGPVFSSDGIDVGATGTEIGFGRAEPGAIAAMSKLMGRPPADIGPACAALRAARWQDGTTLFFEARPYDPARFVGWQTAQGRAGQTCAGPA